MKKIVKARITVIGAVVFTAVILSVSLILFSHSTNSRIETNTEMYITENARASATVFNTKLNDQLVMLESQVRYFRDINLSDYNAMKDTIIATKGIGAFKSIGVANTTGATINYNGRSSGNVMLTDYFRQAINGRDAISETTYTDEDGDEVLVLAVPISQGGKTVGVVYGTFTMDVLNSLIDAVSISESGANLLIDQDGTIIAHSSNNVYINDEVNNFREIANVDISTNEESVFYYKDGTREMLAVVTPIGLHDWNFVTIKPSTIMTELSSGIALSVLYIILVITLAFILLFASIIFLFRQLKGMTAEKERIGAELNVATKIQADMLPYNFPEREDVALFATMTPAKEVGGDFYDFFFIEDDRLALVMADVSGKGVPAALFMVISKSIIRNVMMMSRMPVSKILEVVNNVLCENNKSGYFVTTWIGVLDLKTGELEYGNAGHEYPAFKRAGGKFELLVTDNYPPLAAMEEIEFASDTIQLEEGDALFLYTDGVPEAKNAEGARFGTDKMLEILNKTEGMDLITALTEMKKQIDDFTGAMDPFDDVTMMGLKYYGKK